MEPNSDSEMSSFDGDDSDDDEYVSDKIVERINDDFVETDDESKNIPMEYPMEEITPKTKLTIRDEEKSLLQNSI